MMAAERAWLSRWQGNSPTRLLGIEDVPSLAALQEVWTPLRVEMMEFVTSIDDPDRVVIYRDSRGGEYRSLLWPLVVHVVNHGTEHRSQLALYLAMQGIDMGNLDLSYYLREDLWAVSQPFCVSQELSKRR